MSISARLLSETRAHPSRVDESILYAWSGSVPDTQSGVKINQNTALENTSVWNAITILSQSVAMLPLHLYKRLPDGKQRAPKHPLYKVLHSKPNPFMTSMTFRETAMGHLLTWGNFYAEKEGKANTENLWPLLPNRMDVKIDPVDAEPYYVYNQTNGKNRIYSRREILHIPGLGFDGLMGYSPISKHREAIGLGKAMETFGAKFFGSGAQPGAVLQHPSELSQDAIDRLKKQVGGAVGGLSGAHKLLVLEEGMTWEKIGLPPEDSQFIESRQFSVIEVARIFNIPPHFLKSLERSTFSNIEQQALEFVMYSLMPWLKRFEQAYSQQCLTEREQEVYFAEHLVEGLLRGDTKTRAEFYKTLWGVGALSPDDIRELENMNPLPEGQGKDYYVPLNYQSMKQAQMEPQQIEPETPLQLEDQREARTVARASLRRNRIVNAYHPMFVDAAQTIVNRESLAIRRAAKQHLTERNQGNFETWMDEFYSDLPQKIKDKFTPVLRSYTEMILPQLSMEMNEEIKLTPEIEEFIRKYLNNYSFRHVQSSISQLNKFLREVDPSELQESIEVRMDEWSEKRAEKIAVRETNQFMNGLTSTVVFSAGMALVWRNQFPSCPYCQALEGRVIQREQHFVPKGDFHPPGTDGPMLMRTGKAHPPLHSGCDCFAFPSHIGGRGKVINIEERHAASKT